MSLLLLNKYNYQFLLILKNFQVLKSMLFNFYDITNCNSILHKAYNKFSESISCAEEMHWFFVWFKFCLVHQLGQRVDIYNKPISAAVQRAKGPKMDQMNTKFLQHDSTGDRTQNLWFRRPAPYPLGHGVLTVSPALYQISKGNYVGKVHAKQTMAFHLRIF